MGEALGGANSGQDHEKHVENNGGASTASGEFLCLYYFPVRSVVCMVHWRLYIRFACVSSACSFASLSRPCNRRVCISACSCASPSGLCKQPVQACLSITQVSSLVSAETLLLCTQSHLSHPRPGKFSPSFPFPVTNERAPYCSAQHIHSPFCCAQHFHFLFCSTQHFHSPCCSTQRFHSPFCSTQHFHSLLHMNVLPSAAHSTQPSSPQLHVPERGCVSRALHTPLIVLCSACHAVACIYMKEHL